MCTHTEEVHAVLSVSGPDQVGLLATATEYLASHGGNIKDDVGHVLGNFAFLHLLFTAAPESVEKIRRGILDEMRRFSPTVVDITREESQDLPMERKTLCYEMDVIARDRRGLAAEIQSSISHLGVNLNEARGTVHGTGASATYVLSMNIEIPNATALREMRRLAQKLEDRHRWVIDLRPAMSHRRRPATPMDPVPMPTPTPTGSTMTTTTTTPAPTTTPPRDPRPPRDTRTVRTMRPMPEHHRPNRSTGMHTPRITWDD